MSWRAWLARVRNGSGDGGARRRPGPPAWATPLLGAARAAQWDGAGCPVCRAVETTMAGLAALLAGSGTGPEERRALPPASPLCREHLARLGRQPAARELLAAGRARLQELQRALDQPAGRARTAAVRAAQAAVLAEHPCPACELATFAANESACAVAARLERRDQARLAASLCRRHLPLVLARTDRVGVERISRAQLDAIDRLLAELAEYFRKVDYRYRSEPRGAEQTAWRRGIARLVGPEPVGRVTLPGQRSRAADEPRPGRAFGSDGV